MKRQDYISWDEYFMGIALLSAQRSKDSHTQVGACIVNHENKILSLGYNGMPTGCCDDDMPWERNGENPVNTKYMYVCHAELNAILNRSSGSLEGAKLYVTHVRRRLFKAVSRKLCICPTNMPMRLTLLRQRKCLTW